MAAILFLTALAGIVLAGYRHEPAEGLSDAQQRRTHSPKIATGTITAIVFVVLYAPLFISVLFSLVEIRQGKILWETFSFGPYVTLWSNPSVLSALSNTAVVALTAGGRRLGAGGAAGALHRMGRRDRPARPRTRHLSCRSCCRPSSPAWHFWCPRRELGINRGIAHDHCRATRSSFSPSPTALCSRACRRCPARSSKPPSILAPAACRPCATCLMPHLASAVVTGAVLALTLSFDETLISTFVAGDQMTLPLRLWAMMRVGFTPGDQCAGDTGVVGVNRLGH